MAATQGIGTMERVGLTGIGLQPLYLAVELVVATVLLGQGSAPYSFLDNTISDLGATTCTDVAYPWGPVPVCSPAHALMNAGFVLFGLALAGGAVLARRRLPGGRLRPWVVGLLVVAGLSSVGTGLVPLDRDLELHALVSTPAFLAQPLAVLLLAPLLRRSHPDLARSALVVGVVSLVAAVVFFARAGQPELGGLWERLALWPSLLWFGPLAVGLSGRVRPAGARGRAAPR